MYDDDNNDGIRQHSTTKYVDCNFWMKIVEQLKKVPKEVAYICFRKHV
jgi:hypothetical protein